MLALMVCCKMYLPPCFAQEHALETQLDASHFRWTHWGDQEDTEAFIGALSLGKGKSAATKLADMKFPKGTNIQISLPTVPDGGFKGFDKDGLTVTPFFRESDFLKKWILQGIHIEFLVDGKALEIHTLAALDKAGNPLHPSFAGTFDDRGLTSGNFYFDGLKCDTAEDVVARMGESVWAKGSILMICCPEGELPFPGRGKMANAIGGVIRFLRIHNGVLQVSLGHGAF